MSAPRPVPLSAYGAGAFVLALLGTVVAVGMWPTTAAFVALGGIVVLLALGAAACAVDWREQRAARREADALDAIDADALARFDRPGPLDHP